MPIGGDGSLGRDSNPVGVGGWIHVGGWMPREKTWAVIKNPPVTFHEILGLAMLFGGQKFLFLEIEENQTTKPLFQMSILFQLQQENKKTWLYS